MSSNKIRFVCATREDRATFLSTTALGKSLSLYSFLPFLELRLFEKNALGLPQLYNMAINESRISPAVMVFIHDDVHLADFYWADRILEGLQQFQIIGLAGNRRRVPKQPSWAFIDKHFTWDSPANLTGVVGHGTGFPCAKLSVYGPSSQEVKLLDGLMLACRSETLIDNELYFDERFNFHLYDVDFCRSAQQKGVRMGTWPISVIHESGGNFGTAGWRNDYNKYLDKWGN